MASSSSSPSTPAFSSQLWKYHVFLSFRGEDTRNTFVGHLYSALEQEGIYTYKDDETLPRGELIRPSLINAIEESQIAVVVFSENYGDSSWCLDELAHIMKCRDTIKQIVVPIFYDVDPSDIRRQRGKYGEAFAKHELENKTKVESWRKALVDASNISGWEPKHIANGDESKGIKQIIVEISQKLQPLTSSASKNLIGMAAPLASLRLELQVGSGGVRMLGIWGVGGGGKTTLASSIYDEIYNQFNGCCFVQNIREESRRYGLGKLEKDILSKMGVNRPEGERCMIKDGLCRKKVLIVLDDVDHLDQLKALAGSHDWFGSGSRIIITTRDKHLLAAHNVNVIHNIRLLNDDEALKLFCKHAPRDNRRLEDYEQLSKEVVSYAGGLPLALTVLSSFLCDKDIHEWMSAIARLKRIPDTEILEKLKISFDGLEPAEKELFLDIAYFFRGEYKVEPMRIFDACDFHPVIGVKVLIQKALITITDYGMFDMHDLIQEMGHYIVRGKHPKNPEKHSRVCGKDIEEICAMDATTTFDMIEAIHVAEDADCLPEHLPPIVANTKNLRWIKWKGDLSNPLLTNFPPRTLCCLILKFSPQIQLWEGYKFLPHLKTIELLGLHNLIMTPNFDGVPNLERFSLQECRSLKEIHPSIVCSEKLVLLCIEDCESLKMFPRIPGPKKLETLSLARCRGLFNQHQDMYEPCPNFFVTCWTCRVSNMKPSSRDTNMSNIGLGIFLKDLRDLNLSKCSLGDEEIGSAVSDLPNLIKLNLSHNEFSQLNFSHLRLPRLKWMDVSWCKSLVGLSELPPSIAAVIANECDSLENFGDISHCKWLWYVSLMWENKLGPDVGDILLDSMLQGNASEDYFINFTLKNQIPKRFVGRLFRWGTIRQHLPDDWYNDFCGFSICIVTQRRHLDVNIHIKQEVDKESLFEDWQEFNEAVEPEYDGTRTCVGYFSFGSLRYTALSNSKKTMISVSINTLFGRLFTHLVGVELVPRKRKGDQPQTTKFAKDFSELWDDELGDRPQLRTFVHDSKSSIWTTWVL